MASTLLEVDEEKGELTVSMRLDNCAENVVAQLACASTGVPLVTYKTVEDLGNANLTSHAVTTTTSLAVLMADVPLSAAEGKTSDESDLGGILYYRPKGAIKMEDAKAKSILSLSGLSLGTNSEEVFHSTSFYYNSPREVSFEQLLHGGVQMGDYMNLTEDDKLCIPVTLNHAFGFAGALAAFGKGSAVVLPSPKPNPAFTLAAVENSGATILFADTHTLKALDGSPTPPGLRGGLVKVGSGEVLGAAEPVMWGNVPFATVGESKK
jgi:acyl-CoA synthetase (AMP-forming)/AMP-acid ligase II